MIRKLGLLCSVFVLVQHTVSAFQVSGVTDTWFHSRKFSSVWHFGKQKNGRGKTMQGQNMLPMDLTTDTIAITTTISGTWLAEVPVSPEPIHTAFTVATFLPQPFWLLMIALPNNPITKKIMGGLDIPLLCCLVHFFIVATSIVQQGAGVTAPLSEFNNVFDPSGDPQKAFMGMTSNYPNFVAEEWSHVLTWDIFVGRYVWMDGLKRGIFTAPAVLFCNLIGPPGLLIHWITCKLSGKPIFEPSEKQEFENL
ncbi:predicted protein [Phaeodactylum tricornutum CCAP 1055/1]|jgi:hypothetical protein|uniref:Uncharacterized protein n=1 Tax=Phaeodactylum tricornutum (strain CCAP 1055/1) TaxID=556484 RepID=B7FU85_PHATC|nr:predicted protein [Phaeodactylum tricornutum CCAP 1055/1]EEC49941.1 predicted protein [Phaeodactylum tricornutum CCAP 1055/1]|eukprot:XP_002178276.1 predicted protein [Phaeodactylum tricornutum CCAP 1055/1]